MVRLDQLDLNTSTRQRSDPVVERFIQKTFGVTGITHRRHQPNWGLLRHETIYSAVRAVHSSQASLS